MNELPVPFGTDNRSDFVSDRICTAIRVNIVGLPVVVPGSCLNGDEDRLSDHGSAFRVSLLAM